VKVIHGSVIPSSGISAMTGDEGNPHFEMCGDFLMNSAGPSVVRYFTLH
jgi:hypothetical protein